MVSNRMTLSFWYLGEEVCWCKKDCIERSSLLIEQPCFYHTWYSEPLTSPICPPGEVCPVLALWWTGVIWRHHSGAEEGGRMWELYRQRPPGHQHQGKMPGGWAPPIGKAGSHLPLWSSFLPPKENKSRQIRQFHFHGWPEVGIPSDGKGMISIIAAVQKQQQQSGNHPITVHCRYAHPSPQAEERKKTQKAGRGARWEPLSDSDESQARVGCWWDMAIKFDD